ncbi:cytochrome c oxidase assembly protein PET191, partial [Chytriomyces sp. MP71]
MPSCERFRESVLTCLRESDCVVKRGLSVNECLDLKNKDVSQECRLAQRAFFECQLAMLNPRRRMRGPYGG